MVVDMFDKETIYKITLLEKEFEDLKNNKAFLDNNANYITERDPSQTNFNYEDLLSNSDISILIVRDSIGQIIIYISYNDSEFIRNKFREKMKDYKEVIYIK